MSCGGGGAGDGGQAEWQRIYDRVEALAMRLEVLSEFWDARDKINQALLHQAELSRSRWEAAYRELLPGDNPKLTELLDSDLDDSRTCEALFDTENSELKAQLEEVGSCVHLNENTSDHENISGDLLSELRKLKRAYETLCSNKDKEATEEWQKLQQNIEELQVAAQKKDDEIGRLQAEASASKKKILVLEGDIQKLKVGQPETCKCKLACLSMMKIGVSMQFPGMCVHYNLEVMESDTVYSVKAKIKGNALGLPIDMQRIEYNDKQLVDGRTLKEQGIQEGAQLVVRVRSQILVKRLTGQLIEFSIDDHFSDTTIYSLKEKICFKIGLAPHLQRLIYNGKWLEDACTLADYNIRPYESTTIRLALNSQGADIDNPRGMRANNMTPQFSC